MRGRVSFVTDLSTWFTSSSQRGFVSLRWLAILATETNAAVCIPQGMLEICRAEGSDEVKLLNGDYILSHSDKCADHIWTQCQSTLWLSPCCFPPFHLSGKPRQQLFP